VHRCGDAVLDPGQPAFDCLIWPVPFVTWGLITVSGFQIGYPIQLLAFWIRPGMREVGHTTGRRILRSSRQPLPCQLLGPFAWAFPPDPCNAQRECDGPRL
jgi:hypothetical protein